MIARPRKRHAGLELGPEELLSLHTAVSDSLLMEKDGSDPEGEISAHVERLERIRVKIERGLEYVKGER